jgi:predicted dehydrogenase
LDVIAAEKHVLSEKPAATTYEDYAKLEKAVKSTDKVYQVGLECRFLPVFQKMRNMIQEKAIGNPRMVWCHEFREPFREKVGNWIMFQEKTGGAFVEKTCHYFDLMTWFADSTPKMVTALAGQDVVKEIYGVKPDVIDNGWAMIEYENGAKGVLGLCMFCKCDHDIELGVLGDEGKMKGFYKKQNVEYTKYGSDEEIFDAQTDGGVKHLSHGGGVYYEHLHFVDNIRNNKIPLTNIDVAKWSIYVGLAAEESARNGSMPVTF